jgi:hypothetical protein
MGIREEERYVTVYHNGIHACEARKTVDLNQEGLKKKFEASSKTTPRQAADDIIIEALVNEDISLQRRHIVNEDISSSRQRRHISSTKTYLEDVHNTVDSVIKEERVRYTAKRKPKKNHIQVVIALKLLAS